MCGNTFNNFTAMPFPALEEKRSRYLKNSKREETSAIHGKKELSVDSSDFFEIASDALLHVVSYLNCMDTVHFGATCRAANSLVESEEIWMNLCSKWESQVNLPQWRSQMDSAKCLYRLLSSFESLLGTWVAQDLSPRGGLLYITYVSAAV